MCQPARTCGETSSPPLLIDFTYFVFARRTQDTSSSMMRRCSTPSRRRTWPPFSSSRRRRPTPSARPFAAGVGRGCGRAGGREGTRMRRAVAAERERMGTVISIGYRQDTQYIWVLNSVVRFRRSAKCFRHFAVTHGEPVRKGRVLPRRVGRSVRPDGRSEGRRDRDGSVGLHS